MNDMLWSIDPVNDSMEKTLERMNEFAEGLRITHECSIQLLVDEKVKSLKLDMKSRHEIFFIFKEALNNIVQHSRCSDAIIHIYKVNSTLSIKIHNNGTGIEAQSIHTINGIEEMKKRAGILNAMLDIQTDKKGSSVILQVPLA
ncbi:MAG: hypothetical protein WKF97_16475 [Chitinophagaceae bacterium]